MKKTLWEKFGDFMETLWTWPVFLALFILGFASCAIPVIPLNLVCVTIGCAAFYAMLSAHYPKAYYDCKGSVTLPSGEEYHYNIVKVKWYQRFPIVSFMTPFYLIPFRTDYFIVHNTRCLSDIEKNTKIDTDILDYENLQYEKICKAEYKKIISDPQYCREKFSKYLAKQQASFNACVKKFEDLGNLQKVQSTGTYAIYKTKEDIVLFLYSGEKEKQVGIALGDEIALKILNNEAYFPFEFFLTKNAEAVEGSYVYLNDETYRKVWFKNKSESGENSSESVAGIKQYADIEEISNGGIVEDDRAVLTNYALGYPLRKTGKWKYMLGCILICYFGSPVVIAGCISLTPIGIILAIAGLAVGIYFFRKCLIKYKSYPKSLPSEEFTVVKAVCTEIAEYVDDERFYTFSDGSTIKEGVIKDVEKGFPCFLVYRNENNKLESAYSAITHKLADEVKFIDKMTV